MGSTRMRAAIVLAAAFGLAAPAAAGPWPRDAGQFFFSVTHSIPTGAGANGESAVYGEYGLGNDWTLGVDAGLGTTGFHRAALFLRRSHAAGAHRFAWELGVGVATAPGASEIRLRPGLSWGMGIARPLPGWFSVDLRGDLGPGEARGKIEATVGVKPTRRLMGLVQLQVDAVSGKTAVHLAPAAVWELRPGLNVEIGVRAGVSDGAGSSLRLGTWLSF
jgi:hypothetical protein